MSYGAVPGGRERVEREREEAHRAYHDAFARLDAIVNDTARAVSAIRQSADPEVSGATVDMLERIATFESLLVVFLQQITPYIDTKVRPVEQQAGDATMTATAAQRAAMAAQRALEAPTTATSERAAQGFSPANTLANASYLGFEDLFRGSEEDIRDRQKDYVALFAGATDVLDVGCGRGEFLSLLGEAGVRARGIDLNEEMVAVCCGRGLQAERADAVGYLSRLPDESLGGLFAAQVVEHLEPAQLAAVLRDASRVLRPGTRLVIETINPACWVAFFESYIRDLTHTKPLHPETLKFLVVASGFRDVDVRFRSAVPEDGRLRRLPSRPSPGADAPLESRVLADLVAAFNLNMERLNDRMFTHLDYAVVGIRT